MIYIVFIRTKYTVLTHTLSASLTPAFSWQQHQSVSPVLFFLDLERIEERSNTCEGEEPDIMRSNGTRGFPVQTHV